MINIIQNSYKVFYASYSLIHFHLFLQLNSFLLRPFFQSKSLIYAFFRHYYTFWYFSVLLIKSRIFNILLQIIERTNVFSKRYDILDFSNFIYLPQIMQYNFFIYLIIENILALFCHSFHNH